MGSDQRQAKMSCRVLAVDDDPDSLEQLGKLAERMGGMEFSGFGNPEKALAWAGENTFDIALFDYRLPVMTGVELAARLKARHPGASFLIVTAFAEVDTVVEALRAGVFDFLKKPLSMGDFRVAIERALNHQAIKRQNQLLRQYLRESAGRAQLIGASKQIAGIREKAELFARYDAPVLLLGETGVGKEVLARHIHATSPRAAERFVAVNCSAFSEQLLESELFGHEKGSYTGADRQRAGRLEYAGGGTILLDELCDIAPATQVKLLRVLQEREFERVGGNQSLKLRARIISATNKDINKEIRQGRFREDLYYRLNTLAMRIPPLRERKEDIELFAGHFLERFGLIHNKEALGFTGEAMAALMAYQWPGNVRQLEHCVEYAVIHCDGAMITPEHLPAEAFVGEMTHKEPVATSIPAPPLPTLDGQGSMPELISGIEQEGIRSALERNRWNRSKAAKELGLTLSQLLYRIKKYGIE
ncbi:MAG: sigma-54-dependent Fis family transcriptional regulator [Nitrospinae bacterium]|nr:sigma-54-dependent Fis family transcriptional regulator [Nitrospinota bacterium]